MVDYASHFFKSSKNKFSSSMLNAVVLTFVKCSLAVVIGQVPQKCIAWMIAPQQDSEFQVSPEDTIRCLAGHSLIASSTAMFLPSLSPDPMQSTQLRAPMSNLQQVRFFISYLRKMHIFRANAVDLFWVNRMEDTS